jgi:inhibitor of KinA
VLNQNYYRLIPVKQDIGQLLPLFAHQIQNADLQGVTNVSATDAEILIECSEPLSIHKTYFGKLSAKNSIPKAYQIPVCFAKGLDWKEVESQTGMTKRKMINALLKTEFTFSMYGFLPGFMYCLGLNVGSITRKEKPRKKVAAGSFALGHQYAGFYNIESPGGWQIIGQSPINLFDKSQQDNWLSIGDKIKIQSITLKEWTSLKSQNLDLDHCQI